MVSLEPVDPLFLQIALGVFMLGVCFISLQQVARVLERQCRLRELEERVRVEKERNSRSGSIQ